MNPNVAKVGGLQNQGVKGESNTRYISGNQLVKISEPVQETSDNINRGINRVR
jgi:hypothetical protein